ncbi:MAG: BspA family leucine-rich repeat surface protein, partial [Paludibacteraceae bacterium]|nr:BspA family leucine-rich repeat surface protein [Paludibacteraceae bacterium]
MKKFFLLALALISGMVGVQKINAATLYAVLSSDKTTVMFYYDDKRSERGGKTMWESDIYRGNENKITTVTFMSSVESARPTTGYHFFYNLYNLTTINNLKYLRTSEMNNMEAMFYNCAKLTSLDISHFNTEKVQYMKQMFADCRALETLT